MAVLFHPNEVRENIYPYELCLPGADVVDICATNVYRGCFTWQDYEQLLALAGDKPIALGKVGRMLISAILLRQLRGNCGPNGKP